MHIRGFLALGLLGLVGACGGDDDESMSREDFCFKWADAACSEETVSVCQARDEGACRSSQQDFCLELVSEDFVPDRAESCLEAVGKAYKDANLTVSELETVLSLAEPCDRLVRGPQEEGEVCDSNNDCDTVSGMKCVITGGEEEGTCEMPKVVKPGLRCTEKGSVCEEGFYCDGKNCISSKEEGEDCATAVECGSEWYCSDSGVCESRGDVGDKCVADEQCVSNVCFEFTDGKECIDRLRLSRSEPICDDLR